MAVPAVKFGSWATGADPVLPTAGVDGLAMLVPVAEPVSVGEPPVAPALTASMAVDWPVVTKPVRGWDVTRAAETALRPRWRVFWPTLTKAERDLMLAWLLDDVGHGLLAWDLTVDGPEAATVKVRFVGPVSETTRGKGVWSMGGEVEEVW